MIRNWMKYIILFSLLLLIDYLMKWYTVHNIGKMDFFHPFYPFGGVGIIKLFGVSFSLNYVQNVGAAWGSFAAYASYLIILRILIAIGLLVYLLLFNKDRKLDAPLILIFTGAIGNIMDYFIYHHVVDMFLFRFGSYSFPVFNFADSYICIGIFWLIIYGLFFHKGAKA